MTFLRLAVVIALVFPPGRGHGLLEIPGHVGVPIAGAYEHRVLVNASIDVEPVRLLVDTGAAGNAIDIGTAERIGRRFGALAQGKVADIGGRAEEAGVHVFPDFRIGGITFPKFPALVREFAFADNKGRSSPFHGIAGFMFLRPHGAILDFDNFRLFLRREGAPLVDLGPLLTPRGYRGTPLVFQRNAAFVEASVGAKKFHVLVDTGATVSLLSLPLLRELGVKTEPAGTKVSGVHGEGGELHKATVAGLVIAGRRVEAQVGAAELGIGEGLELPSRLLGIAGYEFYARHRAVIDFASGRMYLAAE